MLCLTFSSSALRLLAQYPNNSVPTPFHPSSLSNEAYDTVLYLSRAAYWRLRPEVAQTPCVESFHLEFARAWV